MKSQVLISIIIPVYNSEHFIRETLHSCINQSYTNLEIIIVNDGSTDDSELKINEIKDPRIQYFKIKNSGACEARNYGINKAKGQLFQFLDADDILDKEKLFQQVVLYEKHGDDFIYGAKMAQIIEGKLSIQSGYELYEKNFNPLEYFETVLNQFGKYLTTGIWLTPAKLVNSTAGWDESTMPNDDGEYFMRLLLNAKGIIYSKKSIFFYRRDNASSISKVRSKESCAGFLNSYLSYSKHFINFFEPSIGKNLAWKALSVYYCNFYGYYPDLTDLCFTEIKKLGYSKPNGHGGSNFKKATNYIGVTNALRVWSVVNNLTKKK